MVQRSRLCRRADAHLARRSLQRRQTQAGGRSRLAGVAAGQPEGRTPRLLVGGLEAEIGGPGIGEPTVTEHGLVAGDTCHVDVVDRWGNMVSATPSGDHGAPFRPAQLPSFRAKKIL